MKIAMESEIGIQRESMYNKSTENVRKQLNAMLRNIEEEMSNRADEVFVTMRRDYRSILGVEEVPQGEVMPKWAKDMRRDVMKVITGVEEHFTRLDDTEDLPGQEAIDPMDLDENVAAQTQPGTTTAASISETPKSPSPDGEANRSSDGKTPDADPITGSAHDVKSEADVADHLDRVPDYEKQQIAGQVSKETEMSDVKPIPVPQLAVEDSLSSSSRALTPVTDDAAVTENSDTKAETESAVADGDMDSSAKDILDW